MVAVGGSTPARPAGRIASMLVGTALGTLILALTLTLTAAAPRRRLQR